MLPLKDDNPTSRPAVVTVALIAANVIVHVLQIAEPASGGMSMAYQWGLRPFELVTGTELTPNAPAPALLTILSSMFLHGGLLHLGGNMLYLWIFGNNIEDRLGHFRFLLFYLTAGVIAALAYVAFNPQTQIPLIGASGAVSGVLGAYVIRYPRARVLTVIPILLFIRFIWIPAYFVLGFWFVLQLVPALSQLGQPAGGGIAYMAHVGGFVVGVIGALVLPRMRRGRGPAE